jgi:hypothetical protein
MKLQPISTPKEITGPATWDSVKYWSDLAAKFSHASVAAQVMCGFALNELKKTHGITKGKRTDLPHGAGSSETPKSWPDLVMEHAGISEDTAGRWMKMADGVKGKWKKLAPQDQLKQLMAVPPSQWKEEDTKLITTSLHKIADGQTQTEFMRELGLAKKKPGNTTAHTTAPEPKKKLSTAEAAEQLRALALEDSGRMGAAINASNRNFFLLTETSDTEIDAQIAILDFALKLRRKWVATPKAKRDAKEIEAMMKESPLK